MTPDEQAVIDYLKQWPNTFVSGKEIARKIGGKEKADDRGWILSIMVQLLRLGLVEGDQYGHYKLKVEEKEEPQEEKLHIAPQILKILKSSGKRFDNVNLEAATEPQIPTYRPASKPPAQNGKKEG